MVLERSRMISVTWLSSCLSTAEFEFSSFNVLLLYIGRTSRVTRPERLFTLSGSISQGDCRFDSTKLEKRNYINIEESRQDEHRVYIILGVIQAPERSNEFGR